MPLVGMDEAGAAAVEEERFGDDIGGIEGAGAEGDDGVESGGGTDVYEGDEDDDEGGDDDGEGWDGGFGLELVLRVSQVTLQFLFFPADGNRRVRKKSAYFCNETPSGQTTITRQCPYQSRRRCHCRDCACSSHKEENRDQY